MAQDENEELFGIHIVNKVRRQIIAESFLFNLLKIVLQFVEVSVS